jgi:hypothetical protein
MKDVIHRSIIIPDALIQSKLQQHNSVYYYLFIRSGVRVCILFCLFLILFSSSALAQTTWLPIDRETSHLADRLETLSGSLSDSLFLANQPISRKEYSYFLAEKLKENEKQFTRQDKSNIHRALSVHQEWAPEISYSQKNWIDPFYKTPADFISVHDKKFFLSVNPAFGFQFISDNKQNKPSLNAQYGVVVRGKVGKGLGFYAEVTHQQETAPAYVQNWQYKFGAVPGAGPYTISQDGRANYLLVNAHVDVPILQDYISATAGFGKHFIGDGIRSLFISDFAAAAPYLRINTRVWKLHYQNLYMELVPQHGTTGKHKYLTMHHLSINATRWLNIGLFETVVFGRGDRFEFGYLNPIIFYRQTERALGSPDKVSLGINFKAIVLKRLQFYGQFLLNEFTAKEFFANKGYWANKWGLQLGGKYFNAFSVKNLDLQAELNLIRPYTYTHRDLMTNFTHYNQPLAHPLGAGIREFIGQARYQPHKDWVVLLKAGYYQQGQDTGVANYGSNILKSYDTRESDYGVHMINGVPTHCTWVQGTVTYQFKPNLFIDLGTHLRRYEFENNTVRAHNTALVYGGIRYMLSRRSYDFF